MPPLRRPNKKALKRLAKEQAAREAKEKRAAEAAAAGKSWWFFGRKAEKPKVAKLDEQGTSLLVV